MGQKKDEIRNCYKKGATLLQNKGKCNGILYITNINRPEEKPSFRVPTPGTSVPRGIINDTFMAINTTLYAITFCGVMNPFMVWIACVTKTLIDGKRNYISGM